MGSLTDLSVEARPGKQLTKNNAICSEESDSGTEVNYACEDEIRSRPKLSRKNAMVDE